MRSKRTSGDPVVALDDYRERRVKVKRIFRPVGLKIFKGALESSRRCVDGKG